MPTESELLRIKKELKARAKKLHLGKARTGAYVYGTLRKIRGNPVPFRKIKNLPDTDMAEELFSYFENDENLLTRRYPQFELNLERKTKRGVYDPTKAVKLFMYLADEISKRYSKDYGDGKTHAADVPTRYYLATLLLKKYEDERWPIKQNPAPAGYHYMPDGRLMADSAHRNPSTAARLRRQAEILEMDERLVPSTLTYEDIKDDPKLIAHYKKIMTPMAWKQLVDDWIRSGVRSGSGRRDFVIPKESEYRRMVSENPANPDQYVSVKPRRLLIVQTLDDLEKLRSIVQQGRERIESVEGLGSFNGKPLRYAVRLLKLEPYEKDVWGESFYEYAARAFPTISKNPPPLFGMNPMGSNVFKRELIKFIEDTYEKRDEYNYPENARWLNRVLGKIKRLPPGVYPVRKIQNMLRDWRDEDSGNNDNYWYLVIDRIEKETGIGPQ